MTYETAKKLKDAGFPFNHHAHFNKDDCNYGCYPTLSELIEALGDRFYSITKFYSFEAFAFQDPISSYRKGIDGELEKLLERSYPLKFNEAQGAEIVYFVGTNKDENAKRWLNSGWQVGATGETPEEAVANLWLKLNENGSKT